MATASEVMNALKAVMDPEIHRNVVDLNMVRDLRIDGGTVSFTLALTIPSCPLRDQIAEDARRAVGALPGVQSVQVTLGAMTNDERNAALGIMPPQTVRHDIGRVIAVMSGKGGVGKSLVTGLLATALKRAGHQVGILDADVTGASIPKLFGIHGPLLGANNKILPILSRTGIKIMSVNLALDDESAAFVWRGAMITKAIQQFWNDVDWGALDFLLVDMPPGTSDAALTVMQDLPVNGILMVTSPQSLATMIVKKALDMAQKMNAPILGVIENMAGFTAPDTSKHYEIFGPSHAGEVAEAAAAPLLARLPIDPQFAERCDAGEIETLSTEALNACVEALVQKQPETV
jgi:ATP-binding protein involved in chromosome partitioning